MPAKGAILLGEVVWRHLTTSLPPPRPQPTFMVNREEGRPGQPGKIPVQD
jgi:hypothetical protein